MRRSPFREHWFPRAIILTAERWYCRFGLSYRDERDLLAERGVVVDASTGYRWVQKFGPEIARRSYKHQNWRGLNWHVDETYVRVGGKWRYLWRAIDQFGRGVDFRLAARRNAKAARAFLRQAFETARLYRPVTITTDKAWIYKKIIAEKDVYCDPPDQIRHIDRKYLNNRIASDHAALKKVITLMRGFQSLKEAKATLKGIKAIRMIVKGGVYGLQPGVPGQIDFIQDLFAAKA